jgi:hypothetical protein
MSYINDIDCLMKTLGHDHTQEEWQLSTNANKVILKSFLLHIGNEFPSFPLLHATHMTGHIRTYNFSSVAYNITHSVGIFAEILKSQLSFLACNLLYQVLLLFM